MGERPPRSLLKRAGSGALRFLLLIGVANLFADLTYEGARSMTGPFLAQMGATAAVVSIVSGFGEFVGYALRGASGYFADKTGRHWLVTMFGYTINMLAVPALALAGSWPVAAGLIVAERTGRAIRRPIVEGMISHTREEIGGGRAFGINEALDQAGATAGPLVMALVLAVRGDLRVGFAGLLISALLCLSMLVVTRWQFPNPQAFERAAAEPAGAFPRPYWFYLAGGALIGFGFVDFSLIAFHFQQSQVVGDNWIPIFYAAAMAAGAVVSLWLGRLYDQAGFPLLFAVFLVGAFSTPLVFLGAAPLALVGMVLWGIEMGAQETLLKATVARFIHSSRRSTAFGIFDTGFGVAWLIGSITFGLLYDRSLPLLVIISVVGQLAALPVFLVARSAGRQAAG